MSYHVKVFVSEVLRESNSGLAILVVQREGDEEVWVPKSQLKDGYYPDVGRGGTIEIPEWLAEEKGFEYG
jgi:hypothetical protein